MIGSFFLKRIDIGQMHKVFSYKSLMEEVPKII